MKNKFLALVVIVVVAGGAAFVLKKHPNAITPSPKPDTSYNPNVTDTVKSDYVLLNVPFTSQAPTGNWSDPRQQDGCEEASLLMAWAWINNQTLVPAESEKTIIAMSEFEKAQYGNYLDLDAEDTAQLMKDYYHYGKLTVKLNITIDDIKKELEAGRLVIVPANGQKLNNPHFTGAGPLTHMVVVRGFDDTKNQIITNDPGTRFGNKYIYDYNTFYNAMVDYPSGHHEDQTGRPKAMIVVER